MASYQEEDFIDLLSDSPALEPKPALSDCAASEAKPAAESIQPPGLFFASDIPDPASDVELVTAHVLKTATVNPIVETFLADEVHLTLFKQMFARHCNLIKSRSQSFDECHVTVYDKVLLRLTDNGKNFNTVAARHYFCTEFLAIDINKSLSETSTILSQNLTLKAVLAQGKPELTRYRYVF